MALRHLLERAETTPPETNGKGTHRLLVINHLEVAAGYHQLNP